MTDDTKPIEFTRNGERRIVCLCQQDPDGKWTAPVMATPADLAAAIKAMPSTQRTLLLIDVVEDSSALGQVRAQLAEANARIVELEHESETAYLKQRSAELGLTLFQQSAAVTEERLAVANARIAELEAALEAGYVLAEEVGAINAFVADESLQSRLRTFMGAHQALRAKPSPAGKRAADARQRIELEALDREPAGEKDSSPLGQKEEDAGNHDGGTTAKQREAGNDGLVGGEVDSSRNDRHAEGGTEEPRASARHHEAGGSSALGRRSDDGGTTHIVDGFLSELGCTVRDCLDCGCLVPGGPTRCKRCAFAPPAPIEAPLTNDWREKVVTVGMLCDATRVLDAGWANLPPQLRAELERIAKGGAK